MKTSAFPDFLDDPVEEVARKLLGCLLERKTPDGLIRVRIVETEAYDQHDEASHAFGGKKQRNATLFAASGHLYVYFTYGMHHCCNVVSGPEGFGSGTLIRAAQPLDGISIIERNRGLSGKNTTNGPGKLCQALAINRELDGHDLRNSPLRLIAAPLFPEESITTTTRIGISRAKHSLRRYFITNNPYISRH